MKLRAILYSIPMMVLLLVAAGCSATQPNPSTPDLPDQQVGSHQTWGAYDMTIDLESKTIDITPNREMMLHFNINGYMHLCEGGCFKFWIVGIIGTVLEIKMEFTNPVKFGGYDVRIIFTHLNGKIVLNPDSYTDLFDPPSTPEIANPFIAFMKSDPNRYFPANPAFDQQTLFIDFPPGALAATSWVIDASWPSNCPDPYEIFNMSYTGHITQSGGSGTVSCYVHDHQGDVSAVSVDTTPLMGVPTWMNEIATDVWSCDITNTYGLPEGDYSLLIKAESPNTYNASCYNYVTVTVEPDIQNLCDGAMNFIVCSDGNWLVDGTIDVLDTDGEQFVNNYLDYTPTGPASNYHTFYYWGGKGGSFRNGNTSRIQSIAESLGYTFRKQENGDLDLSDVRVIVWPAIGHGETSNPPSDDEILAIRNLLSQGGRMIITSEYDSPPAINLWINDQLARLGSSIWKDDSSDTTNMNLAPEECEAYTHDVDVVLFRAWGHLYSYGDTFTMFYDQHDLPIMLGEAL
jgi:hypothetical protein